MSKVIEIIDQERIKEERRSKMESSSSIMDLYNMSWQDYLKHKKYDKDVKNMCSNCQKEQIRKYGKITIKCSGPKTINVLPEDIISNFTADEYEEAKQEMEPYYWAEKNIDIHQRDPDKRLFVPRWYQKMQLQCSANKKAIRCGRRAGKSYGLALDITNRLMVNSNYQILVVTPFLSQAKELADTVRKLIRAINPELGDWDSLVKRSVTSPYQEIQLTNGSTFKAFTAGNDNANAVRGQGAHLIVIDEADFLSQEAFDSIMAILMDKPNTEIICTSTPMGENIMYKLSQSPEYKEFHFPSFVIPHYNDDMDKANRENLSIMGYVQEIISEFGLDDNAVFQSDFINEAIKNEMQLPVTDVISNRQNYIVSLGCDWNADKVGTRIVILAYSKIEKKIFVASIDNVRREGWTQVAAVQKIVDLNRKFEPDYLYVDEGFGEANVQQLKLIAVSNYGKLPKDHPDLRLNNVTPVNFASTLELRDVVTGDIRKKFFKNFIVETTKRALEKGLLSLAGENAKDIVEQMRGYIVKSRLSSGREIYEAKSKELGDHDLDAFMIALAGIHLNQDSILDTYIKSDYTVLPIDKKRDLSYNQSDKIEKRVYSSDDVYDRRRRPNSISRRSEFGGRAPALSRSTATGRMNSYRQNMKLKYR
jgi:hypothetical protein